MLTWQVDRFLRSGPLTAIATFMLPALLALVVAALSDVDNVLGIVLVASLIIFCGSVFGSVVTAGFGSALFGLGAVVAESSPWLLLVVGIVLYANLVLHDLAGAFHRAPRVNPVIWRDIAVAISIVVVAATVLFAGAYFLGTRATWQSIVVPFGIAAIGFAAKLAADSHADATKRLTRKRRPKP